jgi:hypothetical protein
MVCVGLDPESSKVVERGEPVVIRAWLPPWRCTVEVDHRSFAA